MTTFAGFEPVFGAAQGELGSASSALHPTLPFLFCLRAKDGGEHLQIHLTDFHANTWHCDMSAEFLEDKRDEVGIGGRWEDFVTYMRAAFGSDNVKIFLGGPASAISTQGATTARVVGQKAKGTPKIWVELARLEGAAASDAMSAISVELFKVFRSQSGSLSTEMARAAQLSTALMQEKVRADRLQDQLDALSFTGKKKRRPNLSFADPSLTQTLATPSQFPSQYMAPSLPAMELSTQGDKSMGGGSQVEPAAKPAPKNAPAGPRVRAAPAIRRPKRRGTTVAAVDDENKE